jgi:GNAT superfamily N-acetyltransferase
LLSYKIIRKLEDLSQSISRELVIEFLYKYLDKFGDSKSAISKCLDYALADKEDKNGFILTAYIDDKMVGVVVMIGTGMKEYIPENFLVYVAVNSEYRGQGIGGEIIKKAIEMAEGDVALHVEYDNPAKRLYERLGFKNKYAEMRYAK